MQNYLVVVFHIKKLTRFLKTQLQPNDREMCTVMVFRNNKIKRNIKKKDTIVRGLIGKV